MNQTSNGSFAQNQTTDESDMAVEQWLAVRKEAGLQIDPETAELDWEYGQILDPYRVRSDLPKEAYCVGRVYFARSPDRDVWVCFYDLPAATAKHLREKIDSGSARWAPSDELAF